MIDQRGLGTRIINIDEHGKSTVKNAITSDKRIGEIQLVKQDGDYICNLCRNPVVKCFSEDHVPPQSMGNKGEFHYINYLNFCTRVDDYYGLFRGGIKYKTVCDKCNMEVLSAYDRTIGSFANNLLNLLELGDTIVNVPCNPHHILKGLIGHCLSASLTSNPSAMELQLLAYFWGNSKFQDCIRVYVLPFIDRNMISILREIGWVSAANQRMFFSCIKCYPFGFMIVFDGELIGTPNWNRYLYDDREQTVEIDTRWKFDKWFPELYYPKNSGKLLGHTAAHSILGFRNREALPSEIVIG